MKPASALIAAALLGVVVAPAGADQIYRWVDQNGVVNYTQLKPRDQEAEAITTRTGGAREVAVPATAGASAPAPAIKDPATGVPLTPEQESMLEGLRAAERARQQEIAKIKTENCQRSRDVLARLTVKNRLRVRDDDGQYSIMGEDEREARIAEAQENIVLYCVPS